MNKNHDISERLQKELQEGERVLWHGRAESCRLLEGRDGGRIIRNWVITVVVLGGFGVAYVTINDTWKVDVLAIILGIMAIIILTPVFEWIKLKNQQYWITDRRTIMNSGGGAFFSVKLEKGDIADVKMLSTGNDCVLVGAKIVEEGEKQLRWRSSHPMDDNSGKGMVFYNVRHADEALEILRNLTGTPAA